jgi:hypothetical protein
MKMTALRYSVTHVILMRSEKKMIGPHASAIVAAMANE